MKYILNLTFPPSVNNYWINSRGGKHKFLSSKAKEFRERTSIYMKSIGNPTVGDSNVALQMHLIPKNFVKRDVDNFNKGVMDALKECGFYKDDSQCIHISNTKYLPMKSDFGIIIVVAEVIKDNNIVIPSYTSSPTDGIDFFKELGINYNSTVKKVRKKK